MIVDTSLAVKWVLIEPMRPQARALLRDWIREDVTRLVPTLFLSEINTPLLRLRRQGSITPADVEQARADLLSAVTVHREDAALTGRAFRIADQLQRRAAYDSLYIALAERERCELWTADERLYNAVHTTYPFVHWLGEVSAPSV